MFVIDDIILAVGLTAMAAGTATSVFGSTQQAEVNSQRAANDALIATLQQIGTRFQRQGLERTTTLNTDLLELQRQQNQLRIATERGVIGQQRSLEDIRQANNELLRGQNVERRGAAIRLEQLNQANDYLNQVAYGSTRTTQENVARSQRTVDTLQARQEDLSRQGFGINRERDAIAAQAEVRQQEQADIAYRRQVRDAIRQGTVASATGLAQAINRGGGTGSTQAAGLQANAITAARLAISDATQAKGGQDILRGLSRQDRLAQIQARLLGEQNFELGSQIRGQNIFTRESQFQNTVRQTALAEHNRQLGVEARGVNFGLSLGGFDVAERQFALNNQTFGINRNISDIYLNAQDQNAALVNQASGLNQQLLTQNTATQDVLYGLQESIYGLGATNSTLASQAASYGGLTAIGGGLTAFGSSVVGNAGRIGQVAGTVANTALPTSFFGDRFSTI